jgi:hypothetical protein
MSMTKNSLDGTIYAIHVRFCKTIESERESAVVTTIDKLMLCVCYYSKYYSKGLRVSRSQLFVIQLEQHFHDLL